MAAPKGASDGRWPLWLRAAFLLVAYMLAAELGNLLSVQRTFSTFWPPAGIFVAALLLADPREWPVLLAAGILGNISSDLLNGRALAVTLGFSAANSLEALAGAALVRRFGGGRLRLDTPREVASIAAFASLLAPALGATVGTNVVAAAYGTADWWLTWRVWWIGDAVGVAVFTPLILTSVWALRARGLVADGGRRLSPFERWMNAATVVVMGVATWFVFSPDFGNGRWKFTLILGSLVSAMYFGALGGSIVLAAVAMVAAGSLTLRGAGVSPAELPYRLLEVQVFIGVTGVALLGLAAVDARHRRLAVESRATAEKYRVVFEEFPLGVTISDAEGGILETSRRAEQILGVSGEDQKTRGLAGPEWRVVRTDGTPMPSSEYASMIALRERKVVTDAEMGIVTPEGTTWLSVTAAPLSAEGYGVAVAYTDITAQKEERERRIRSEMDLAAARDNLELEVARRTRELETANRELRAASEAKTRFLQNVSHELRTPLNSIIGFTGIILQGLAGPLNAEQERELTMVKRSGQYLLGLVNDLLDITKVESGGPGSELGLFAAREVMANVADATRPLAEAKGLEFSVENSDDIHVLSDFGQVRQILQNLLTNAVKFTETGSVALGCVRDGDTVHFSVRDTGIGIPPESLPRIMDEFVQVDSTDGMKPTGTGLGLAISRRLAVQIGGSLSVSSVPGEGSTFVLALPAGT